MLLLKMALDFTVRDGVVAFACSTYKGIIYFEIENPPSINAIIIIDSISIYSSSTLMNILISAA